MVEAEEPAESFAAKDAALRLTDWHVRLDEVVVDPLVVPLGVVVGFELPKRTVERLGAEEDELPQALRLDGADEALRDRVAVRSAGRAEQRSNAGLPQGTTDRQGELAVAIDEEEPRLAKEAVDGVREQPRALDHEGLVRNHGRRDDPDSPGRMVDHEERKMGHQPAESPD